MNFQLFKRHRLSTFFIATYYIWWLYLIYSLSNLNTNTNFCGAANFGAIFITGLMAVVYFLLMLIRMVFSVEQTDDYIKLGGLVGLPMILVLIFWAADSTL